MRIVLATVVMGAAVAYGLTAGHSLFPAAGATSSGRVAMLFVLVALGVVIYAAALHMLGVARIKDLVTALRTRK